MALDKTIILDYEPTPHTLPQEVFTFVPTPEDIRTTFPNKDSERKIYLNTTLNDDELAQIRELKEHIEKNKGAALTPFLQGTLLRYLSHSRGNVPKAFDLIYKTMAWRQQQFEQPIRDSTILQDLKAGFLYFCGRDRGLRPTLIFRVSARKKTWTPDIVQKLVCFVMEWAMQELFVPGVVESINVVLDLKGLGFTDIPVKELQRVIQVLAKNYVGRLYKMYVIHSPMWISGTYKLVTPFLSDRQQAKIKFLSNPDELISAHAPHQLEKVYGGTREPIKEFYPFPLLSGPFDPKSKGENASAVKHCRTALLAETRVGTLLTTKMAGPPQKLFHWSEHAAAKLHECNLSSMAEELETARLKLNPESTPNTQNEGAENTAIAPEAKIDAQSWSKMGEVAVESVQVEQPGAIAATVVGQPSSLTILETKETVAPGISHEQENDKGVSKTEEQGEQMVFSQEAIEIDLEDVQNKNSRRSSSAKCGWWFPFCGNLCPRN